MTTAPLVSTVVPTYNRIDLLPRAIDSALAQSHPAQEIIVIDDGSTDGTRERLAERYGSRVRCFSQPNRGVSVARNTGMARAQGEFIALLDSDDVWLPDKLAEQVAYLAARPDYGMVLCDVQRVDGQSRPIDVFRRRAVIPHDGHVLEHVLMQPSLVPASVLLRRSVVEALGGFDVGLRTAEDIDFHLRVAARYPIGSVDKVLVRAMRGHEGLSRDDHTQLDYLKVMERFVAAKPVSPRVARRALFAAYARNARSALVCRRTVLGRALLRKTCSLARQPSEFAEVMQLGLVLGRVAGVDLLRSVR